MKQSGRDRLGINLTFNYNIGTNFFIRNDLAVDNVKAKNSPYNEFYLYANQIRTIVFMMRMESLLRSFLQEIGILCIMLIWRKRIRVHIHLFKIILILIGELFRHCDYKDVLVIPDNLIKGFIQVSGIFGL